jgi:hypothetical protein
VVCDDAFPIRDGPFSCDFVRRRSPCFQDYESEACAFFLDDATNPCLRRPAGPSCYRYLNEPPEAGCEYPPDDGVTLTPRCSAWVAAFTELCQTRPDICPGPYGGSEEFLTAKARSGQDPGRGDELFIPVADSDGDTGSATGSKTEGERPVALASTGLDLAVVVWTGLVLLGAGLLLHTALRAVASVSSAAPPVSTQAAVPHLSAPGNRGRVVWTGLALLACAVLIRPLLSPAARPGDRTRASR